MQILEFKAINLFDRAFELVLKMLRIEDDDFKEEIISINDEIINDIKPKVILKQFDNFTFCDTCIKIDDISLKSEVFKEVKNVDKIYGFIATIGDVKFSNNDCFLSIYFDSLLSAYVQALAEDIKKIIKNKEANFKISECFGAGYYGIDASEMADITKLFEIDALNIKLNENKTLFPHKSCAGFHFLSDSNDFFNINPCKYCLGNKGNCSFCHLKG